MVSIAVASLRIICHRLLDRLRPAGDYLAIIHDDYWQLLENQLDPQSSKAQWLESLGVGKIWEDELPRLRLFVEPSEEEWAFNSDMAALGTLFTLVGAYGAQILRRAEGNEEEISIADLTASASFIFQTVEQAATTYHVNFDGYWDFLPDETRWNFMQRFDPPGYTFEWRSLAADWQAIARLQYPETVPSWTDYYRYGSLLMLLWWHSDLVDSDKADTCTD